MDGLDPAYVAASQPGVVACVRDGQPLPYTSATFLVIQTGFLLNYTDKFGPSSSARSSLSGGIAGTVGSVVLGSIISGLVFI